VAVEYLAANLGLTAKPILDSSGNPDPTGTNFAVLGSATGVVTQLGGATYNNYMTFHYSPLLPDLGINEQLDAFAYMFGGVANPQALYFLWGGANDAYLALEDPGIDQNDATQMNAVASDTALQAVRNLSNEILALAGLGARDFLVPNLPDLGLTPDALFGSYGTAYAPALSLYTTTFNTALASALQALDAAPLLDVTPFDTYGLFNDFMASGLYNTGEPCILATACDPQTYLFWDGVHPTTHFHALLGEAMARAVPVPATIYLMLLALMLMGGSARIHSHLRACMKAS